MADYKITQADIDAAKTAGATISATTATKLLAIPAKTSEAELKSAIPAELPASTTATAKEDIATKLVTAVNTRLSSAPSTSTPTATTATPTGTGTPTGGTSAPTSGTGTPTGGTPTSGTGTPTVPGTPTGGTGTPALPGTPGTTQLKLTQADIDAVKNAGKITAEDAGKLSSVMSQTFQDEAALKTAIKTALEQGAPTGTNKDAESTALATQVKTRAAQTPAAPTSALPAAQPQNSATMFSASVDVSYSRKWGFEMTASSKVTAKIVAVPAPQAFLDALEDARAGLSKRTS